MSSLLHEHLPVKHKYRPQTTAILEMLRRQKSQPFGANENMRNVVLRLGLSKKKTEEISGILMKTLPIIAFIPPLLILYSLYPASFEATWKGRTFYIFFVWLALMEIIMSWENLVPKVKKKASARNAMFFMALLLPTAYVVASSYGGLGTVINKWGLSNNVGLDVSNDGRLYSWMPLSTEYLVLAVLFVLVIWSEYGFAGLKDSAISSLFLATIGIIYTIDNFYPNASFTPFQALVPATSTLAANFLSLMGYKASFLKPQTPGAPLLQVQSRSGLSTAFSIAWPCSGIESLLIYAVTILLFLKRSPITWMHRIAYFAVGAIVTYFINILRIATIFIIQLNTGGGNTLTPQAEEFHNFYGQLYSITWIMAYPLMIMGSQILWNRVEGWRNERKLQRIPTSVTA
jgi:thaumarchaeosortase